MCCSRCGKKCSECSGKDEYGCAGCHNITDGYWGSKCEIKECCESRNHEHCGLCKDFPCELLREISYDDQLGDDGERLINCKKWADTIKNDKEKRIRNILIGISVGIMSGVIIGEIQGMVIPWLIAGFIVGIGVSVMFIINRKW